jgi:hypothetical protein
VVSCALSGVFFDSITLRLSGFLSTRAVLVAILQHRNDGGLRFQGFLCEAQVLTKSDSQFLHDEPEFRLVFRDAHLLAKTLNTSFSIGWQNVDSECPIMPEFRE